MVSKVSKMSLDKIDRYIAELEALKEYGKVLHERDEALKDVEELEMQLSGERQKVERLTNLLKQSRDKDREKEEEVGSLREALKVKDYEIKSKKEEVDGLERRIRELQELKAVSEGKTLREAEGYFLKAKEDEIRRRTDALFRQMKSEWEESSKFEEVRNDAIKLLKVTINNISKGRVGPKDTADSGIYKDVMVTLDREVQNRINVEFNRRVEAASEQRAEQKLEGLKAVEWPTWYKMNVEPKIVELESMIKADALRFFTGVWNIPCDKCGTKQSFQLTSVGIEELLTKGKIALKCVQINCNDAFGRHRIMVGLRSLIEARFFGHQQ